MDYLIYYKLKEPEKFDDEHEETISSFISLLKWVNAAKRAMLEELREDLQPQPCGNVADMERQVQEWSDLFDSAHIDPLWEYMELISNLQNVFAKKKDNAAKAPGLFLDSY